MLLFSDFFRSLGYLLCILFGELNCSLLLCSLIVWLATLLLDFLQEACWVTLRIPRMFRFVNNDPRQITLRHSVVNGHRRTIQRCVGRTAVEARGLNVRIEVSL